MFPSRLVPLKKEHLNWLIMITKCNKDKTDLSIECSLAYNIVLVYKNLKLKCKAIRFKCWTVYSTHHVNTYGIIKDFLYIKHSDSPIC